MGAVMSMADAYVDNFIESYFDVAGLASLKKLDMYNADLSLERHVAVKQKAIEKTEEWEKDMTKQQYKDQAKELACKIPVLRRKLETERNKLKRQLLQLDLQDMEARFEHLVQMSAAQTGVTREWALTKAQSNLLKNVAAAPRVKQERNALSKNKVLRETRSANVRQLELLEALNGRSLTGLPGQLAASSPQQSTNLMVVEEEEEDEEIVACAEPPRSPPQFYPA
ncbi:protein ORF105 [Anguillid herpesvirus 1]|uniref:Protein ORF105 n=1 Tax=Anguillid herpesvirus 1 TaxID=150286 RepID=A0A8E5EV72_9VIRU|nr:protein ORF105 [Anguillid herpesvirus 1]QRM17183.1 protein ORF105 [Anguillid herpesvirus 1]UWI83679.1 protein ORF105 [Anguillid herpesvirus 1]